MNLTELAEISAYIGSLPNLVQGPGGNTSLKVDNKLYVKASGTRLSEALSKEIFCQIDLTTESVLTSHLRPSIELGLHQKIPAPIVVHVHSIGSLAWALRKRTRKEEEFLEHLEIHAAPYLRPGDQITNYLEQLRDVQCYEAILLQNHGLITWGNSSKETLWKLLRIEAELYMAGIASIQDSNLTHTFKELPTDASLTPDHAVFNKVNAQNKNKVYDEVTEALDQALRLIPLSAEISTIPLAEANFLRDWEAEKYRKSINS